jgi:Cu2+-exporting ATPase
MTQCTLCDLPTPEPPITDESVPGAYCCRGCLEVARVTDDPTAATADDARGALEGSASATDAQGSSEASRTTYLSVTGMHCATCESFLEHRAEAVAGVSSAMASYPSGAVRVSYDPAETTPGAVADRLSEFGYEASQREAPSETAADDAGRLLVGGFFGMMTMLWYVLFLYPTYLGVAPAVRFLDPAGPAGTYLLGNILVMTTVVLGYTGWPILRGAVVSLLARDPNMDLLVAVAATTAYLYSVIALLLGRAELYFDITTIVILAVTVGDYYQERIRRRAVGRLDEMSQDRVETARRRTPQGLESVSVEAVDDGDELVVKEGERIPVDGTVIDGSAAVSNALVTGEAVPVTRRAGDSVVAGARIDTGGLVIAAEDPADRTMDRVLDTLWRLQSARSGGQRLADRIASAFVPLVLALAVTTAAAYLLLGTGFTTAMLVGLSVLVVSCPCALGLATPLAIASGTSAALKSGIVLADGTVFETADRIEVVAFDKTGTLTTGRMELVGDNSEEALARAAAVEQFSDHPVAAAITRAADSLDATVTEFESVPGRGVSALVDGETVLVGSRTLFEGEEWAIPDSLEAQYTDAKASGRLPALVGWDGKARDLLVARDEPRDAWESVVEDLGTDHEVVVITGDDEAAAAAPFRDHHAVDEVFAGIPPEGKAAVVDRLQQRGPVAMVGDGTNDAPALAAADLGIAMEQGTALAVDAAHCVIANDDLTAVPDVFAVTGRTRGRIRQNLGWAFTYNAVAVPLAVTGVLNPVFAAAAMVTSSLLVVANSARRLLPGHDSSAGSSGEAREAGTATAK